VTREALPDRVPFLQRFADGEAVDAVERPADVPLPGFIRYLADDLKALYWEGYMAVKPAAGDDEIARWFRSETALGQLLRRVRERLERPAIPPRRRRPSASRADVTPRRAERQPPRYARFTSGFCARSRPVPLRVTRPFSST
jgi:hypothetical protein